jgi:hypothetical protein
VRARSSVGGAVRAGASVGGRFDLGAPDSTLCRAKKGRTEALARLSLRVESPK